MRIFNCTPHEITIFDGVDVNFDNPRRLLLKPGAVPSKVHHKSGIELNATMRQEPKFKLHGTQIVTTIYESVQNPLELIEGSNHMDIFIVSALFRTAFYTLHSLSNLKLVTISSAVYRNVDDRTPAGCLYLDLQ